MKLKVCGMKYTENIQAVATLQPDYLGFIFYKKSSRNFEGEIPKLPPTIKKAGVFVDSTIEFILEKTKKYNLEIIQLHGEETPIYCTKLKQLVEQSSIPNKLTTTSSSSSSLSSSSSSSSSSSNKKITRIKIWKVFSIKDQFDFKTLKPYENSVDYFLFDTKGKEKGGNGYTFDWNVLKGYNSPTPFILSGGIGLEEIPQIKLFLNRPESKLLHAIDVNSKFEIKPGFKNTEYLKEFKNLLSINNYK